MLKHIFKTELIAIRKNLSHSLTNIIGLALGVTAAFLIFIYVKSETSFDKHFEHAEQIYRVGVEYTFDDQVDLFANIARPVAKTLGDDYAEIAAQTRVVGVNGLFTHSGLLSIDEKIIKSDQLFFADSTYFDVFKQNLIEGNPATALTQPNSIVITTELARRLFNEESVLNRTIRLDDQLDLKITGIMESSQSPTHLPIEGLVSWHHEARPGEMERWLGWHTYTYIRLSELTQRADFEEKLPDFYNRHMKASFDQFGGTARIFIQPVTDIHLNSDLQWEAYPNGSMSNVYIFSTVGVLIILLVCINYTNLTTAKSIQRTRETGIRKVLGSNNNAIVLHTFLNALIVAALAALLSLGLIYFLLPFFGQLSGLQFTSVELFDLTNLLFLGGLFLLISIVSAIYPAIQSSTLRPVQVINNRSSGAFRKSNTRKVLVGLQFIIAAGLLFATSIVLKQTQYILNRDLGFDKESSMIITVNDTAVQNRMDFIKSEWLKNPAIAAMSTAVNVPTEPLVQVLANVKEIDGSYNSAALEYMEVDYDFPQTLGVQLAAGRFFDRDFGNDAETKVLINETLAKIYGGTAQAIGRKLAVTTDDDGNNIDMEVIGVVKDFHTISFHAMIQPIVLTISETPAKVLVKLKTDDLQAGIDFISREWDGFNSSFPLEYTFLDDGFKTLHNSEMNLQKLLIYFCGLIIAISCLGLLGLVSYSTKSRLREVTIRKVMGSSNRAVFKLLIREYLTPVLLALIVAIPLGWILIENWLGNFSYRTDVDLIRALIVVLITMIIAFVTVSFQTNRLSHHNPINTLRHE